MTREPSSDLDRRLLFVLQRAARVALVHANARVGEHMDVSVAQLAALSYIRRHPGCGLTELADLLDANKSAITGIVRRLERAGLVKRAPNPKDARGSLLTTTAKADRLRDKARPVFREVISDMTEGFDEEQIETVLRFLNGIVRRFGSDMEVTS